jgi:hypothetical protein
MDSCIFAVPAVFAVVKQYVEVCDAALTHAATITRRLATKKNRAGHCWRARESR